MIYEQLFTKSTPPPPPQPPYHPQGGLIGIFGVVSPETLAIPEVIASGAL